VSDKSPSRARPSTEIETKGILDALRASEEQLRLLLDSTAEGLYALDDRGICTFCNSSAATMLGLPTPNELLGKRVHFLVHHTKASGQRYPLEECHVHQTLQTGIGKHIEDEVFWRPDGTSFPVEYWSYPIKKADSVAGVVVAFVDATERRLARLDLEDREARFRQLTEVSFDGIAISENGVVVECNRGFAEMFGYLPAEVIGRSAMEFVAEESVANASQYIGGEIDGRYDLVGKRKDGSKIILEATGKNRRNRGRLIRITAVRDVTEKRSVENQFRQAQRMEAVGRLASGVAHDFNNLLTVIMSYTDMLLEDVPTGDASAEDLGQIRQAALTASSLTRQLLAFSRQQVIQPRPMNLNELVTSSGKILQRSIGEGVTLKLALSESPLVVQIDPEQMEQVIMNLAVNARDAMPEGGTLTIATGSAVFDAEDSQAHYPATADSFGMLAITDTGAGVDEQTRSLIFEPFFTTKEIGKGTGLGLAMVYGIVKQNNGFIVVESELGQGTTFKVYLPLSSETAERYENVPALTVIPRGNETILIVENSPAGRLAASEALRRQGYTVLEAPNGSAALGLASRRAVPIQLLLTDVVMPEMSGPELARKFTEFQPGARVLYMSGNQDDILARDSSQEAGQAYIQKPFSSEALARKVREVLDELDQGADRD